MRWLLVPFLALAAPALAGGKSTDDCLARCSDRLNICSNGCKNGACIEKCGLQMQKCAGTCGTPTSQNAKGKEPKLAPGHVPRPPKG